MAEDPDIEELAPASAEEDIDALFDSVATGIEDDGEGGEAIESATPPPARAWAFDFNTGRFIMEGRSPATVRGDTALCNWAWKCISTPKGSSVVQHPDYGLEQALGDYDDVWDLENDVSEALSFHPSILGITEFDVASDEVDPEAVEITFKMQLTGGREVYFEAVVPNG